MAFSWLAKGHSLLENVQAGPLANHLRILSGAFYNVAGTLFREGKYAFASRFLIKGCSLGSRALEARKRKSLDSNASPSPDKERDAWTALEEGLYKRWEILGVCHSKTGDRKVKVTPVF